MHLVYKTDLVELYEADCLQWLQEREPLSIHAVVTDPPFGMLEYSRRELAKLRAGRGGVWRIPPSIGGSVRSPLPRFTVLTESDLTYLFDFFREWADLLMAAIVPGAHVFVATSPLLSHVVSQSLVAAGLEKRGELVRLVRTLRGGDRPKGAEREFPEVSAMPRSCWEPWIIFRKPIQDTLAQNLRTWGTGGLRRPAADTPMTDVIPSRRTPRRERQIAPHPSLKPQHFLRELVRAALPLGKGVILDPFAGSGSTLAACEALGYQGIGIENDPRYVELARGAIPRLAALTTESYSTVLVHMWGQDTRD
jgi:DNA modification methylase